MKLSITFIASGMTGGDRPLLDESEKKIRLNAKNGIYPAVSRVYTASGDGCRETAALIYPKIPALLVSGIRDFDFGGLSGKSREEIRASSEFEAWANSESVTQFPGGEAPYLTAALIVKEFLEIADDLAHSNVESAAIIAPRSVFFVILARFMPWVEGYPGFFISDGGGCTVVYDTVMDVMRVDLVF